MLTEFAERMKEERERLGLTQREVANAFGVNKGTVYSYERADRTPPGAHLTAMAELGADVLYIVTGQRIDETFSENQLDLTFDVMNSLMQSAAWQKLNEAEKRDLYKRMVLNKPDKDLDREFA